jgi:Flp pilus assembly pilin Flp
MPQLKRFLSDRSGEVSIEYGIIACIIVTAIVASIVQISPAVQQPFTDAQNGLKAVH